MLINMEKGEERLNSPHNLFNRLRQGNNSRGNAMSLFTRPKAIEVKHEIKFELPVFKGPAPKAEPIPVADIKTPEVLPLTPTVDNLLSDVDSKIKLETVAKDALATLHSAIVEIKNNIQNMPVKSLPDVAAKMSKVVSDIRQKQDSQDEKQVHLHFYTPERRKLEDYPELTV